MCTSDCLHNSQDSRDYKGRCSCRCWCKYGVNKILWGKKPGMFKCYCFRILLGTIRLLELYKEQSLKLLESFCSISFIRRKKQDVFTKVLPKFFTFYHSSLAQLKHLVICYFDKRENKKKIAWWLGLSGCNPILYIFSLPLPHSSDYVKDYYLRGSKTSIFHRTALRMTYSHASASKTRKGVLMYKAPSLEFKVFKSFELMRIQYI